MSERKSVWLSEVTAEPRPSLEGEVQAEVVVVGGGVAGMTTALLMAREGLDVVLLEAERIGHGSTGNSTGKISSLHGLAYGNLIDRHGSERAQAYADANEAAIDMVEGLAGEMETEARFVRAPAYVYATSPDKATDVEAEAEAAQSLGLPATLTTETDLPFPVEQALRFEAQALIDVGPYMFGLAELFEEAGGTIFENSRAVDLDEGISRVEVNSNSGTVIADKAVVATLIPVFDRGGYFGRMKPSRAYGVAARLASGGLEGMHINAGSQTRSTRPWEHGVVVVGEGHPTGDGAASPERWGELERWARDNFDVASFDYRWSAQDYKTIDDLPYVGRAPVSKRVYVATGFKKWGLSNGTAAARMLTDKFLGRDNPWIETFSASRLGDLKSVKEVAGIAADVTKNFVGDRLARLTAPEAATLEPGEGRIVREDGDAVAAYRDPGGKLYAVTATCTHLGCTVHWNDAEKSWDCPCHGSRFDIDGCVLAGPAVDPLEAVPIDRDG